MFFSQPINPAKLLLRCGHVRTGTSRGLSFELELPKFQADTKGLQFKWAKGEQSEGKQKEDQAGYQSNASKGTQRKGK